MAFKYYNKPLEIRLKTLGEEHPDVAASYHNIGNLYNDKGEYDNALEYYNKSFALSLKVFGEEHPDVAICYSNIGNVYAVKGDYDSSLIYQKKSLEINDGRLTLFPINKVSKNSRLLLKPF